MAEEYEISLVKAFDRLVTGGSRGRSDSTYTDFSPGSEETEEYGGRTFLKPLYDQEDHRYYLPIDEEEVSRWEIAHNFWRETTKFVCPSEVLEGLFLDIGAGAGHWVQDVATIYKEHEVTGIDLYYSEILETPARSSFVVDDCEMDFAAWPPVSLIHLSDSYFWVRDPLLLVQQIHRTLSPDGWFQNFEVRLCDWTSNKDDFTLWQREVLRCAANLNIRLHSQRDIRNALLEVGFEDYNVKDHIWSFSHNQSHPLLTYLTLTVMASLRILVDGGCSGPETLKLMKNACCVLREADCQVTLKAHTCWAKKVSRSEDC